MAKILQSMINPVCFKTEIVGSIRRQKDFVHDIDIVALPITPDLISSVLIHPKLEIIKEGKKLIQGEFAEIPFDVYLADEFTYETLKLIRTGSKEHNIKLCKRAIALGYKLKASGTGLVDFEGNVLENTEAGILKRLCGNYVEPSERD